MDAQLWSIFNWAKSLKNSPRNIIEGNTKTASNFSHFFFVSQLFLRLRNRNCEYELSTTFCLLLSRCYPWNWHNEIPSGCSASKNMSVNWIWAKNFNRQIKKKKNLKNYANAISQVTVQSLLPNQSFHIFWGCFLKKFSINCLHAAPGLPCNCQLLEQPAVQR